MEGDMKRIMAVLAVAVMASAATAGWDLSVAPTMDGGAVAMLSASFGDGSDAMAQRADPVAGDDAGILSTVATHLSDNWGKYLAAAAVVGAYERVAYNNGYWPHNDGDQAEPVTTSGAGTGTAAAGAGGTANSIEGDGNVTIINNGGTVTYNAAPAGAE